MKNIKIIVLILTIIVACKAKVKPQTTAKEAQLNIEKDSTKHKKIFKLKDAIQNNSLMIKSSSIYYKDIYIKNTNYVVYETPKTRKIIYPDIETFRIPFQREKYLAIDKNGVYFRGSLIKTDTTDFKIIGYSRSYPNIMYTWSTKSGTYKNDKKVTSISSPKIFKPINNPNAHFIDGNSVKELNYNIFYDKNHTYLKAYDQELLILENVDSKTLKNFIFDLYTDKQYLYRYNTKIIESKDLELLAIITGYRSGCGQDRSPSSDYFVLKNNKGYWLVKDKLEITIRFLGKKLPANKEWYPGLKEDFELVKY